MMLIPKEDRNNTLPKQETIRKICFKCGEKWELKTTTGFCPKCQAYSNYIAVRIKE